MARSLRTLTLVALLVGTLGACTVEQSPPAVSQAAAPNAAATVRPSLEVMLAAINGDAGSAGEFGAILDTLQSGGGACNPVPDREHASDVLVAAWEASGKGESLLAFGQAIASLCQ